VSRDGGVGQRACMTAAAEHVAGFAPANMRHGVAFACQVFCTSSVQRGMVLTAASNSTPCQTAARSVCLHLCG
jgi:hypothetical protein